MVLSKDQIEAYIPQRAPFIMVDNLLVATPEKFETDFKILPDNIFLEDGILREFALIENIAQSSAAGLAVLNRIGSKDEVEGFIGGVTKVNVISLPEVNDTLHTIILPKAELGTMFLVQAATYANGKKLLECEVKLVGSGKQEKRTS
jgi:predicted hotdog family 3-hydroxylacyl-ACP dehydratase